MRRRLFMLWGTDLGFDLSQLEASGEFTLEGLRGMAVRKGQTPSENRPEPVSRGLARAALKGLLGWGLVERVRGSWWQFGPWRRYSLKRKQEG